MARFDDFVKYANTNIDPLYQAYKKKLDDLAKEKKAWGTNVWSLQAEVNALANNIENKQKIWQVEKEELSYQWLAQWAVNDLSLNKVNADSAKWRVNQNLQNFIQNEQRNNEAIKKWIVENAGTQQALGQAAVTRAWLPVQASAWLNAQIQADVLQKVSQQNSLSSDKTFQALDSLERLILSIDAQKAANDVNYRNQALSALQQYEQTKETATKTYSWWSSSWASKVAVSSKNDWAIAQKAKEIFWDSVPGTTLWNIKNEKWFTAPVEIDSRTWQPVKKQSGSQQNKVENIVLPGQTNSQQPTNVQQPTKSIAEQMVEQNKPTWSITNPRTNIETARDNNVEKIKEWLTNSIKNRQDRLQQLIAEQKKYSTRDAARRTLQSEIDQTKRLLDTENNSLLKYL